MPSRHREAYFTGDYGKSGMIRLTYDWPNREAFIAHLQQAPLEDGVKTAIDRLRFGYDKAVPAEFADLYKEMRFKISSRIIKSKWRTHYVGPKANLKRVTQGHPVCAYRRTKTPALKIGKKSKFVYVLANVDGFAGMSDYNLKIRGAATLALISTLEHAGYKVRVGIGIASRPLHGTTKTFKGNAANQQYVVIVKDYTQHVNINVLAYALSHRDMLWTIYGHLWHQTLGENQWPFYQHDWDFGAIGEVEDHGADIYFGPPYHHKDGTHANLNFTTKEAAMKWVEDNLIKWGVTLS